MEEVTQEIFVRYLLVFILNCFVFSVNGSNIVNTFAFSKHRQGKKLIQLPLKTVENVPSTIQCISVCLRFQEKDDLIGGALNRNCVAVNFSYENGTCELLPETVCEKGGYIFETNPKFSYFDLSPDTSETAYWNTQTCQSHGRCTGKCLEFKLTTSEPTIPTTKILTSLAPSPIPTTNFSSISTTSTTTSTTEKTTLTSSTTVITTPSSTSEDTTTSTTEITSSSASTTIQPTTTSHETTSASTTPAETTTLTTTLPTTTSTEAVTTIALTTSTSPMFTTTSTTPETTSITVSTTVSSTSTDASTLCPSDKYYAINPLKKCVLLIPYAEDQTKACEKAGAKSSVAVDSVDAIDKLIKSLAKVIQLEDQPGINISLPIIVFEENTAPNASPQGIWKIKGTQVSVSTDFIWVPQVINKPYKDYRFPKKDTGCIMIGKESFLLTPVPEDVMSNYLILCESDCPNCKPGA